MASIFIGTNTFIHTLISAHTSLVTVYRSIGVQESSVRYLKTINNLLTQEYKYEMWIRKKIHGNDTNKTHLKAPNTATVTQITHTYTTKHIHNASHDRYTVEFPFQLLRDETESLEITTRLNYGVIEIFKLRWVSTANTDQAQEKTTSQLRKKVRRNIGK